MVGRGDVEGLEEECEGSWLEGALGIVWIENKEVFGCRMTFEVVSVDLESWLCHCT